LSPRDSMANYRPTEDCGSSPESQIKKNVGDDLHVRAKKRVMGTSKIVNEGKGDCDNSLISLSSPDNGQNATEKVVIQNLDKNLNTVLESGDKPLSQEEEDDDTPKKNNLKRKVSKEIENQNMDVDLPENVRLGSPTEKH